MEHIRTIDEELADFGLKIYHSDSEDREPIDLSIRDDEDNVAWVWGSEPFHDIQWECNHPNECIEYEDGATQGQCQLCGSWCDWHEATSADDGYTIKERVPHTWYPRQTAGGIIGEIIEYYKRTF